MRVTFGNYFIVGVPLSFIQQRSPFHGLSREMILDKPFDYGVLDANMLWAKVPAFIPQGSKAWQPAGGPSFIQHIIVIIHCYDGRVVEVQKGDSSHYPDSLHSNSAIVLMPYHREFA